MSEFCRRSLLSHTTLIQVQIFVNIFSPAQCATLIKYAIAKYFFKRDLLALKMAAYLGVA